ncbi:MAG: alpha/beta hydrolase [candidate division Zixibacteria bacterium]|nr:alpha/beta hydrolase [candidate division Zixibacteria bacterium]
MSKLYCISGLGADERVFKNLKIPRCEVLHIHWIQPESNECISKYSRRLSTQIDTSEDYFLLGLSFGGLLTLEMLKFLKPVKTFLVSSFKTRKELPFYYRLAGNLCLHKIIPDVMIGNPSFLIWFFNNANSREERELLGNMLKSADVPLTQWSIKQILDWKGQTAEGNILHIHGDADRILPLRCIDADFIISGGSHLMIYNRAPEIGRIISDIIKGS